MLFAKVLLGALLSVVSATSDTIGSLSFSPLDYSTWEDVIDLQTIKYFANGTVFIYDEDVESIDADAITMANSTILTTGQYEIVDGSDTYYLYIDKISGLVSVTTDGTTSNGIFYIDNSNLFFEYHDTFFACQDSTNSNVWSIWWRGASSVGVCETQYALANINPYLSSGSAYSEFFPNNYETSIAETATENTATTTATVGTQASKTVVTEVTSSAMGLHSYEMGITAGVLAILGYIL